MRKFFRFLFGLMTLALLIFVGTAVWISFDGLTDEGDHADVALVPGHAEGQTDDAWPLLKTRLDRVVELYKLKQFPTIIVSGAPNIGTYDETATMVKYLQSQGVPADKIIPDSSGDDGHEMALHVAAIMKSEGFPTLMIVSHYYQITRLKLALRLEGVTPILHAHAGALNKNDAYNIARDDVALCDYLTRYLIIPEAKKLWTKVSAETKVGKDKAAVEAKKMQDSVNKSLDNLAK